MSFCQLVNHRSNLNLFILFSSNSVVQFLTKTWYFAFILRMIAASYLVGCPDYPILSIFAYVALDPSV